MSFVNALANIFNSAPVATAPAAAPAQTPTQPGNLPATPPASNPVATVGTAPNGVVPNNPATDANAKSGFDAFGDLWNTETNPAAQGQPLFNVSQEKMMEAARKQNFTSNIPADLMERAAAGGAEGVQAMMEMVNLATQNAYAQSAYAGTRLIEGALEKSNFAKSSDLDTRFKSLSVTNNLQAENPIFANPAAKPMLDMVKSQMLVKYPTATTAELTKMAQDYLTGFATAINAPQQQQQQQQQAKVAAGEDWSKFFG